jgi:23S rRNA (adenine-N6)-dimethyltransferase
VVARTGRSARDRRRRSHGQNFLVDSGVVERVIARLDLRADELVVDVGAGSGALAIPLARAGASVLAIERDRRLIAELQPRVERAGVAGRVRIRRADLREIAWPRRPYRVVASPPYALTTRLLSRLLDDPRRGPYRADLLVQWEVARKRAASPPTTLRSAAWAPWWCFELGEKVSREAFRPRPQTDSAWLTITRREPPILPDHLAPRLYEALQAHWDGQDRRADGAAR